MSSVSIQRHKAAIRRTAISRPVRLAMEAGLLDEPTTVLDYGCGRGDDMRRLKKAGHDVVGWDPHYRPKGVRRPSDIVNLGYVLNVIEHPRERLETLRAAWDLTLKALVVSTLVSVDAPGGVLPFGDGVVTTIGTFQKYFDQQELENVLRQQTGVEPVALGLGVFALARDSEVRAGLLAKQFRRRSRLAPAAVEAAFAENRDKLDPLVDFFEEHGRWPATVERGQFIELSAPFGSVGRATKLLAAALPTDFVEAAQRRVREHLLVLLALSRFRERLRLSDLAEPLQRDVRGHFGSFKKADAKAEQLLFSIGRPGVLSAAARSAEVGKRLPDAIYVHCSAVEQLPPALRVLEGCARRYVGGIEDADVVKLSLKRAQVSYLSYPTFDTDPHPPLTRSVNVDMRALRIRGTDYSGRANPPVLHRKELFVGVGYPRRGTFARLTAQEERMGLFDGSTGGIGTRDEWTRRLDAAGVSLRGHRVVRTGATS